MHRLVLGVVLCVVMLAGIANASPAVQVTDPCGDARMSFRIDENTMQPTGSLSDGADIAALDFTNLTDGSVAVTTTLCGAAVEPVDAGPNIDVSWQVEHCALTIALRDVTSVTVERGPERWNSARLGSSCSAGTVQLDWAEDVTFAGNQFSIRLDAADLGAFAPILEPGTHWDALSASTIAPVSKNAGGGSIFERVYIETQEGRDQAGPGWGFVVDDE